MDTDAKEEAKPKMRKVKKQQRKGDLIIVSGTASLDAASKEAAAEQEASMIMEDKLVADTEEKKNELETYIYDMRNKIDDQYTEFASESEKEKLKAKLEAIEVRNGSFLIQSHTKTNTNTNINIGMALRRRRGCHQSRLHRQDGRDPRRCRPNRATLLRQGRRRATGSRSRSRG